ncbi:hypothetical protein LJC23_01970 [Desulfovibrio sp. OttesenSCG-928-I05]|nr:hypothetical protein [Desulfovibrio sp. OttesenSCG-928-I05]
MHDSLRLLDDALEIARQELRALDAEDEERLHELCEQRMTLMDQAWARRDGCDPQLLAKALTAIQNVQRSLSLLAGSRSQELSDLLKDSRQESLRINGYRRATTQGGDPLYVSRIG